MELHAIDTGLSAYSVWVSQQWLTAIAFFAAALLLDLFDHSLRRGAVVGVSGAVLVAALFQLGLFPTLVICGVAPLAALGVRRSERPSAVVLRAVLARALALLVAWLCLGMLSPYTGAIMNPVAYLITAAVYFLAEMGASQLETAARTRRPFGRMVLGAIQTQMPILGAQWSAAVLLLIIYPTMAAWSLIPVVALLLLMRQSAALLFQVRDAYRTTVEVLVEAAESQNPGRLGHSERTASTACQIAMKMGLSSAMVERIGYVALLHDIDALGECPCTVGESRLRPVQGHSSKVLEGSVFFADVLPILRMCDGRIDDSVSERDTLAALIVALASDIDAAENVRVEDLHSGSTCARVSPHASPQLKARVMSAALLLGFKTPAVT